MRFHGMPSDIGIVSNIGVVEICDPLLGAWAVRWRLINWSCERGHFAGRSFEELGEDAEAQNRKERRQ
jgi:hypothetical protein